MIIEKAGKKPFNPEGVTEDICVEMSLLQG